MLSQNDWENHQDREWDKVPLSPCLLELCRMAEKKEMRWEQDVLQLHFPRILGGDKAQGRWEQSNGLKVARILTWVEIARRFSGNSEYRSQLQELSGFIARGGLITHNQTGPCTSQQILAETDDLRRTWKLCLGFQPQRSSDLDPTFRKHKSTEIKILLLCVLTQN